MSKCIGDVEIDRGENYQAYRSDPEPRLLGNLEHRKPPLKRERPGRMLSVAPRKCRRLFADYAERWLGALPTKRKGSVEMPGLSLAPPEGELGQDPLVRSALAVGIEFDDGVHAAAREGGCRCTRSWAHPCSGA